MTVEDLVSVPVLVGAVLLLWALLALRSKFDAALLALAGALCILLQLRFQLDPAVERGMGIWPEIALAVLGLVMLLRVFLSPLGVVHRIGFGLAGCAILFPFLILLGVILLFAGAFSG